MAADTVSPPSTPTPASWWEDYVDVFFAPTTLFQRRTDGKFGVPLLVFAGLMIGLFFASRSAMQPIFDAEFARGMADLKRQQPNLTPEQLESGRKMGEMFASIGGLFAAPILPLLLGVITLVTGALVGAKSGFKNAMMIGVFAGFPRIIEQVINAAQLMILPEAALRSRFSLSVGVARFLDPDNTSPALLGLVGRLDPFTLWVTVLIAVGLKVQGKVTLGRAVAAGAIAWVVGASPTVLALLRR